MSYSTFVVEGFGYDMAADPRLLAPLNKGGSVRSGGTDGFGNVELYWAGFNIWGVPVISTFQSTRGDLTRETSTTVRVSVSATEINGVTTFTYVDVSKSATARGVTVFGADGEGNDVPNLLLFDGSFTSGSGPTIRQILNSTVLDLIDTTGLSVNGTWGDDRLLIPEGRQGTLHGSDGNDTLIGSTQGDILYGDSSAIRGNGSSFDDLMQGGGGNDTLFGRFGNDTLFGDTGSDFIYGGTSANDEDAAAYWGVYEWRNVTTEARNPAELTVSNGADTDTIRECEYLEYWDLGTQAVANRVPIVDWRFEIDRQQDGTISRIAFFEGSTLVKEYQAAQGGPLCAYDDLTPIRAGTYEMVYRTDGGVGNGRCFDLMHNDGTSTVGVGVNGNLITRTNIQIHPGNFTYNSEGCFAIANGVFLSSVISHVGIALDGMKKELNVGPSGRDIYQLPIPIEVTVTDVAGTVEQPRFTFVADQSGSEGGQINVLFDLQRDGAMTGLRKYGDAGKRVDIIFSVINSNAEANDFSFGAGVTPTGKSGGTQWRVSLDPGESDVIIPVQTFVDADLRNESFTLKIDRFEIFNVKPNGATQKYADNKKISDMLKTLGDMDVVIDIMDQGARVTDQDVGSPAAVTSDQSSILAAGADSLIFFDPGGGMELF